MSSGRCACATRRECGTDVSTAYSYQWNPFARQDPEHTNYLYFSFGQCRMLNRVFVFRLDNDSLARRTMMSSIESTSTFDSKLVPHRSRYARSPTAPRKWSAYAAAVLARLRDLAPYAAIELVLPGG